MTRTTSIRKLLISGLMAIAAVTGLFCGAPAATGVPSSSAALLVRSNGSAHVLVPGLLTAPVPTITGDARVGATLTAVPGEWGPAPVTLAYQWNHSGTPIPGATGSTYTAGEASLGRTITVKVSGSQSGYTAASKMSAGTARLARGVLTAPVPTIAGDARVGATLTAVPGEWGPAPVTLAYQWNHSGTPIPGATGSTYSPGEASLGRTITVKVSGSQSGYTTASKMSASTTRIARSIRVLPIGEINPGGTNVPITQLFKTEDFAPTSEAGASRYTAPLPDGLPLEALLVNKKKSDLLVVSLHGATDRTKISLPRFEWLTSLLTTEYSTLHLSDPTLRLRDDLQLAWYTGSGNVDLYPILAKWASKAAEAVGAKGIIILGSSGGGLASLQVSTYIPGSMALPFTGQTSIANYLVGGTLMSAQRAYVEAVMPHLAPEGVSSLQPDVDWSVPLGERSSALVRYSRPQQNFVYYVQNTKDYPHVEQHYQPFRDVIESGPNKDRVYFDLYEGPETHNPPWPDVFHARLDEAAVWLRETLQARSPQ